MITLALQALGLAIAASLSIGLLVILRWNTRPPGRPRQLRSTTAYSIHRWIQTVSHLACLLLATAGVVCIFGTLPALAMHESAAAAAIDLSLRLLAIAAIVAIAFATRAARQRVCRRCIARRATYLRYAGIYAAILVAAVAVAVPTLGLTAA